MNSDAGAAVRESRKPYIVSNAMKRKRAARRRPFWHTTYVDLEADAETELREALLSLAGIAGKREGVAERIE